MVLDTMFSWQIFDSDLEVDIFFEKRGAKEQGGFDFEIGFEAPASQ